MSDEPADEPMADEPAFPAMSPLVGEQGLTEDEQAAPDGHSTGRLISGCLPFDVLPAT